MKTAIRVEQLYKSFKQGFLGKKHQTLKGLSFSVPQGKTVGFIGVNGSGKTTSLKCILQFIYPDAGRIFFFDDQVLSPKVKLQIGYLPERPYYYEFLTAYEFLKYHWDLSGGGEGFETRAQEVLEKVLLAKDAHRRLRGFSKGMLQRAGLAQALLRSPKLLILDEPMSGLDPDGRILVKEILREEKSKGVTLFFSSHLLGDMDELCDYLVVIDQGQLIYQGDLNKFVTEGNVESSFKKLRDQFRAGEAGRK